MPVRAGTDETKDAIMNLTHQWRALANEAINDAREWKAKARKADRANADLIAALKEGAGHDRDLAGLHYLARRFTDNAPIVGSDKEAAAQIINEYARFIRYARAALAKVGD